MFTFHHLIFVLLPLSMSSSLSDSAVSICLFYCLIYLSTVPMWLSSPVQYARASLLSLYLFSKIYLHNLSFPVVSFRFMFPAFPLMSLSSSACRLSQQRRGSGCCLPRGFIWEKQTNSASKMERGLRVQSSRGHCGIWTWGRQSPRPIRRTFFSS